MTTISLREFRLHAEKYMDKMPLILTIYNKPVLKVLTHSESAVVEDVVIRKNFDIKPELIIEEEPLIKCELTYCNNPAISKGKMFDDDKGEEVELWLCEKHYKSYLRESN